MKRRIALVSIVFAALIFWGLTRIGAWVVMQDPLAKADAIVVFGGELPYRAMEAAKLYHDHWAPEVWVTQGEDEHVPDTAKIVPEYLGEFEYSRKVLEALGVPASSIRIIEPPVVATFDEVKAVADHLRAVKGRRVILVTSTYHTRRVKVTWQELAGAPYQAIVRYTNRTPFDRKRWWRNSRDIMAVFREVGGILNAWAGFPLSATRS